MRDDIIGSWSNDDGAKITFKKDDTFTASNLDVCDDDFFDTRPDSGNGTWSLKEGLHEPLSKGRVSDAWEATTGELAVFVGDRDAGSVCIFTRSEEVPE